MTTKLTPPYYEVKYRDEETNTILTEQVQADNSYLSKDGTGVSFTDGGICVEFFKNVVRFKRIEA